MAGVTNVPQVDAAAISAIPADNKPKPSTTTDPAASNDQKPADQKKDRKPRRERLPLPEVIPETPVKRYAEPSRTDMQAAVEVEDAKLRTCFDRLNSTRAFYDERQKIREESKPAFDAARLVYNKMNDDCRTLFEERKAISNKLKDLKEADIAARAAGGSGKEMVGAGKDGQEALKGIRTIEELEERIKEMQYKMETNSMTIAEEKKIVGQISFLTHKGRDFIVERDRAFKDEKAAKDQRVTTRKELEEARREVDTRIDALKAKLTEQKKKVDDIRAKQEERIEKLQKKNSVIDRDAERKKIGQLKAAIRQIREDYQVELDKWYLNERIHIEQQKIAKRKKYEAIQAEREARRKAWEAEQAQYPEPDPYQHEKDMCSGLTVYLQTLLGETVAKPTVNLAPEKAKLSLKSTGAARQVTSSGKAIGKSTVSNDSGFENLAFSDFVKKSGGKSRGKKNRRSSAPTTDSGAEDATLKPHSIDYITAFTQLDIKPPTKLSEVRAALEAVKAKKVYYDSKPKPTDEEKAQIEAEKVKKKSTPVSKKKSSGAIDLMNGDGGASAFPVLQSENMAPSGPGSANRDVNAPSFMAVASGAASVPPPTPAVSTAEMSGMDGVAGTLAVESAIDGVAAIVEDDPMDAGPGMVAPTEAHLAA